jgi:hypothetical protein
MGDRPRKACNHTGQHGTKILTYVCSLAGFEPAIVMYERSKTVRFLGHAATFNYT